MEQQNHVKKEQVSMIYGKNIVITGTLSQTRSQVAKEIARNGGILSGAVTSKTDILVIGHRFGNTKVSAAFRLGTFMVTEEEFREMLQATRDQ